MATADVKAQPKEIKDIPDPFSLDDKTAAQRFLIAKGWKPQGPPWMLTVRWEDPTRSKEEKTEMVKVFAPHIDHFDEATKQYVEVMKPVQVKDRHGRWVDCEQHRVTPAGRTYSLQEAVMMQVERDQVEAAKKAG